MIGLTLKQLRYFDALARHQHFGRAADTCGITQPALSLQIKELEALAGAPLVERGARQIRLTALGADFLTRARSVLVGVDELEELVRAADGPLAGRLRLGVIPTIAPYLLPQIITALSDRFPALDLEVRETVTRASPRSVAHHAAFAAGRGALPARSGLGVLRVGPAQHDGGQFPVDPGADGGRGHGADPDPRDGIGA